MLRTDLYPATQGADSHTATLTDYQNDVLTDTVDFKQCHLHKETQNQTKPMTEWVSDMLHGCTQFRGMYGHLGSEI